MNKIMTTDKFIPIYKYAKENNILIQNIYRQIREGKIPSNNFRKVIITRERIEIDPNYKIIIRKKTK